MESSLAGTVPVSLDVETSEVHVDEAGWETLPVPIEENQEPEQSIQVDAIVPNSADSSSSQSDERAELEAELARLDASWNHRKEPAAEQATDPALAALEARLSGLDL